MVRHVHFLLSTRDPFLENPGKFSGPKSCLYLLCLHSRSKFQLFLK